MNQRIHPSAIVDHAAVISETAEIGPYCIVGPNAQLGDNVRLIAHVAISGYTTLGADTTVYPFATLGYPAQDRKYKGEPTTLVVGARNIIREHVSMHTGTVSGRTQTIVGDNNYFMASSHVAHDCIVGNNNIFANNATLGGVVTIEDNVTLGGLSAIHQFGRVGFGAFVGGGAPVTGDVIPYGMVDNHGRLNGLNLIGLQRRGASRDLINTLRRAYRTLFAQDDTFQIRLNRLERELGETPEVAQILAFIAAGDKRPLCLPDRRT